MMMINEMAQAAKNNNVMSGEERKKAINSEEGLSQTFQKIFKTAEQNLQIADEMILKANTGDSVSIHELMIAMEKADISLRLMVQVRNKAIEAYQEIMRMQV